MQRIGEFSGLPLYSAKDLDAKTGDILFAEISFFGPMSIPTMNLSVHGYRRIEEKEHKFWGKIVATRQELVGYGVSLNAEFTLNGRRWRLYKGGLRTELDPTEKIFLGRIGMTDLDTGEVTIFDRIQRDE